ncbi:hypothetical protein EDD17DRAFT_1546707 [Pisolithus thermaeus]|nr:hypothetical protein EDD17DRAFT_1546707 [Pisolithus thermaeus]
MRLLTCVVVLVTAVTSVVGQLIELGVPNQRRCLTHRDKRHGTSRTTNGVCDLPTRRLGTVLRCSRLDSGHLLDTSQRGFYQNFTAQIDQCMTKGPASFHFIPFLLAGEFRNANMHNHILHEFSWRGITEQSLRNTAHIHMWTSNT